MNCLKTLACKVRVYQELSKSGIVTLVLISVLAGYLIGQSPETPIDLSRLLLTLVGILCLASSASALNQLQESHLDAQMPRTAQRPLPSGRMTSRQVIFFVVLTGLAGCAVLGYLNRNLFYLGSASVVLYNGFYTLWWKKHWAYGAVPGAIPGALPILMGHVSASSRISAPGGWYLFFLLFFWQMPHFWALAIRYQKDYEQGGFPILPVKMGMGLTLKHIILWCLAYLGLAGLAPLFLRVSGIYWVAALMVSLKVLWELFLFVREPDSRAWLKFFLWVNFSLIIFLAAATVDLWRHSYF